MNVAIFASAFYPHLGGVEEVCRQVARAYKECGIGVAILTNRWPRSLPSEEIIEGITVHRLPMRVAGDCIKSKISYRLTTKSVSRRITSILKTLKTDVLHVHCVSSNAYYALQAQRQLRLPLVVTLHGELSVDATGLFQKSAWAQQTLKRSLEGADAITACSYQTLEEAEKWFGRPFGDRGRVIYNGISLDDVAAAQPYPHPRPYVLAIGRHVPQKGFDILLHAMAKLAASGETTHDLILAGDGVEHGNLQSLAKSLCLSDRVKFVGRVNHPMAMDLFAGCSFFVLPSRHEPFGIVNLEAMAVKKAIIATRVGGVPEILSHGVTGELVPAEDIGVLADTMGRLISEPARRDRLGAEAGRYVQQFDWRRIVHQYMELYQGLSPISVSA